MNQLIQCFPKRVAMACLIACLLAGTALSQNLLMSPQQRAMNAARQIREYRHRTAASTLQAPARGISALKPGAGFSMDRNFRTQSTVFFRDDMESGTNGWTTFLYSGTDFWHQTTTASNSPTHSWWNGIESQGTYNTGSRVNTALITPPVSLFGAAGSITLLFTENYETEAGWDFCMVDVTTDAGVTWTPLRGGYGNAPSGTSGGWIASSLDLTPYASQSIQIRFYFDTHDSLYNDFPGWYVDNVYIFDQRGMITGKTFFDANDNGVKDSTDRGVKNWLVTATGTGTSQGITLTTVTNVRGKFWLPLPLGTYTVTEAQQPGWTQTFPQPFPSQYAIDLGTPDTLVDSVWFGNFTNASFVNGTVFNDVNHSASFDAGDSVLYNWRVNLTDTLGNIVDYDYSDSLGVYQLFVFAPGQYIVDEITKRGWVESEPAAGNYPVSIPNLSTTVNNINFGNYYSPYSNTIYGQVINDRNRNHVPEIGEEGIPGLVVRLYRHSNNNNFPQYRVTKSDSSGYFEFMGAPADTYRVKQDTTIGWWQSWPDSAQDWIEIILNDTITRNSTVLADYQIAPGSIGGTVFDDLNLNGVVDGGENGLGGWTIQISGFSVYKTSVSSSIVSDGSGNFSFPDLWPGWYMISEVWKTGWRQTLPTGLRPYSIHLGPEQSFTSNFGDARDSAFSVAFRTFLPEDLALAVDAKGKHLPIKTLPVTGYWSTPYITPFSKFASDSVHKLTLKFSIAPVPGTITCTKPATITMPDAKTAVITFDQFVTLDDSFQLAGLAIKPKQEVVKRYWFTYKNDVNGIRYAQDLIDYWTVLFPMPNAINFLSAGAGTALKVGLGGPHTVVHPTYKEVLKSLVSTGDRMQVGEPRCLGTYSNTLKSIKTQQKYLAPTKGNNRLFAEAIALQANIKGSDLGVSPGGFGGLIFDEGGSNPFNGLSIREIAGKLDQYMSSYRDTIGLKHCTMPAGMEAFDSLSLYQTIRKINTAFSGPIDTLGFAHGLILKPVAPLASVTFLRLDSASARAAFAPVQNFAGPEVPRQFTLSQNYPNPFNPATTIEFYLTEPSIVTLAVYNTIGQEVARLVNREAMDAGWAQTEFVVDRYGLASGVYYYRLVAETIGDDGSAPGRSVTMVKKMMLLK